MWYTACNLKWLPLTTDSGRAVCTDISINNAYITLPNYTSSPDPSFVNYCLLIFVHKRQDFGGIINWTIEITGDRKELSTVCLRTEGDLLWYFTPDEFNLLLHWRMNFLNITLHMRSCYVNEKLIWRLNGMRQRKNNSYNLIYFIKGRNHWHCNIFTNSHEFLQSAKLGKSIFFISTQSGSFQPKILEKMTQY